MTCQECGREISSCTTVNGRIVCEWCKPKADTGSGPREWNADIERGTIRELVDTMGLPPETYAELSKGFIRVIEKSAYDAIKKMRGG